MQYEFFTTNDHTKLAYQTSIPLQTPASQQSATTGHPPPPSTCILLLHGFSGSSQYFTRNTGTLSKSHLIIAPDMRGHGRSQQTPHGYHVARLATDLHNLLALVQSIHPTTRIYAVGCSIGAAVLWTYVELFTDRDLAGLVFVDQAPLQDRSEFGGGWPPGLAHYGCYDEATTREAQRCWGSHDPAVREKTYADLVGSCLGYRFAPGDGDDVSEEQRKADEEFFMGISRGCDGTWLARLLADHTRYDHREAIELVTRPVLVMAGKRSGCFSVEGMMESVRRVKRGNEEGRAEGVVFESGHWLFWEEPEKFNEEVLKFVESCESLLEQ